MEAKKESLNIDPFACAVEVKNEYFEHVITVDHINSTFTGETKKKWQQGRNGSRIEGSNDGSTNGGKTLTETESDVIVIG